jgi:hypothetical protein
LNIFMVLAKHKMCVAMTLDKGFCSSHSPGLCIAELCGLSERQFENEAGRIVKDCPELHGAFGCLLPKKTRRRWITLIKFFGLSDVAGIDSVSGISFLCFADDERDRNATFTWSLCKSADRTFTATCNEVRNDVRAACSALTLVNERQLQYVESADEEPYDVEMPDAVHVHDAELAVDPQGHHDRGCDDSGVDGSQDDASTAPTERQDHDPRGRRCFSSSPRCQRRSQQRHSRITGCGLGQSRRARCPKPRCSFD